MKSKMCCICGKEILHPFIENYSGNNPWPVRRDPEARCCDECNDLFVIPARIVSRNLPKENFSKFSEALDKEPYSKLLELFLSPKRREQYQV